MADLYKKEEKVINVKVYNITEDLQDKANALWKVLETYSNNNWTEPRAAALFKTNLQQAVMWALESIKEQPK